MLSLPSGSFARAPEPLGLVGIAGGLAASDAAHALLAARARASWASGTWRWRRRRRWNTRRSAGGARGWSPRRARRRGPEAARAEGLRRAVRARLWWLGQGGDARLASRFGGVQVARLRARRRVETAAETLVASAATSCRRRPVGQLGRRRFAPVARRAQRHRPRSQRRPARPEDARGSHDAAVLPLRDHAAVRGVHARAALAVPPRQSAAPDEQSLFLAAAAQEAACVAAGARLWRASAPWTPRRASWVGSM